MVTEFLSLSCCQRSNHLQPFSLNRQWSSVDHVGSTCGSDDIREGLSHQQLCGEGQPTIKPLTEKLLCPGEQTSDLFGVFTKPSELENFCLRLSDHLQTPFSIQCGTVLGPFSSTGSAQRAQSLGTGHIHRGKGCDEKRQQLEVAFQTKDG